MNRVLVRIAAADGTDETRIGIGLSKPLPPDAAPPGHRRRPAPEMSRLLRGAVAAGLVLAAMPATQALAHAVCGNRVFPATLVMDDPGVSDELSLPTVVYTPIPAANGSPSGHSVDYGYEVDKTITRDLGIAINGDYFTQRLPGQTLNGWDNVTVTLKDAVPCNEPHEFMMAVGVIREFGGTGSSQLLNAGVVDSVSNTAPTLYVGKGMGDLPIGYFRPFAVTGELGYQISDSPGITPNQWNWAASLQYSMPYIQQHIKALDVPNFMTRLIPLVETSFSTPAHGLTTGTISPGILYLANTWQLGAEAMIPANGATARSQGTGFIFQFHIFLDDMFPRSIGRPLINRDLWQ